jgi:hypothetical protein
MNPPVVPPLILLVLGCPSGCADVQERSYTVAARTGTPLTASVGDEVLWVSREKDLPNIVGKSDIFGRTAQSS